MSPAQLNRLLFRFCGWSLLLDGLSRAVPIGAGWPVQGHPPYIDLQYNLLVWSVAFVVVIPLRGLLTLMDWLGARLYRNFGNFGPRVGLLSGLTAGFLVFAQFACGEASELFFPPTRVIHAKLGFLMIRGYLTLLSPVFIPFSPWGFVPFVVIGTAMVACPKLWPAPPREDAVRIQEASEIVWCLCGGYVLLGAFGCANPFTVLPWRILGHGTWAINPIADFPWHAFAGDPTYWTPGPSNPFWWWLAPVFVGFFTLGLRRSWRPFFLGLDAGASALERPLLLGGIGLLLLLQSLTGLVQISSEIPAMYLAGMGPIFLSQWVPLGWLVLLSRLALGIYLSAQIPLWRCRMARVGYGPEAGNLAEGQ